MVDENNKKTKNKSLYNFTKYICGIMFILNVINFLYMVLKSNYQMKALMPCILFAILFVLNEANHRYRQKIK